MFLLLLVRISKSPFFLFSIEFCNDVTMETIISASFTEAAVLKNMMDSHMLNVGSSPSKDSGKQKSEGTYLRLLDPETHYKVRRITSKVNDSLQMLANEPSLGLYRIQEHVHRTTPALVERKKELDANRKKIEGVSYDLDYSLSAVDAIGSIKQFTNIAEALKSAIEIKQKLDDRERQENEQREREATIAKQANKSISENEIAEGYICPICYYAHENQDALMEHWKTEHNLEMYENEVFGSIELANSSGEIHDEETNTQRNIKLPSEGEEVSEG